MIDKDALLGRFLAKTQILPNGCWYWLGGKATYGYGRFSINGKTHQAHRVSMFLFKDFDLESDLFACHHCDNAPCVNPDHLFEGDWSDNAIDSVRKGIHLVGSLNPSAKLTENQVTWIRENYLKPYNQAELAKLVGVTRGTIWKIISGKTWEIRNAR